MDQVRCFGHPLFVLTGGDPLESEPLSAHIPAAYRRMVEGGETEDVEEYFAKRGDGRRGVAVGDVR